MEVTTEKQAALAIVKAIADSIKELGRVPAGHLYAALMTHGCTFDQFNKITNLLVATKMVRREGDELVWVDH